MIKENNNKVINDHNINGINDNLKLIKINAKSKKKNVKFTAINFEGNNNKDNKDNKKNKKNKVKVKGKVPLLKDKEK